MARRKDEDIQNENSITPLDDDMDFSQVAMAERSQLYELIKLVKEHVAWKGLETLSELSDPTRRIHLKLMMLRYLNDDHKRLYKEIFGEDFKEVYRRVYGEYPKDEFQEFDDFLSQLKQDDLRLRVSYKRRGRKEFVDVLSNHVGQEKKRRLWQR